MHLQQDVLVSISVLGLAALDMRALAARPPSSVRGFAVGGRCWRVCKRTPSIVGNLSSISSPSREYDVASDAEMHAPLSLPSLLGSQCPYQAAGVHIRRQAVSNSKVWCGRRREYKDYQ